MSKLFIVYSGEYICMQVNSKQIEGTLPALRIEGVFDSRQKCEDWIESYRAVKPMSFISCFELNPNPTFGQIEPDMERFKIRMTKDLQILETTNLDGNSSTSGDLNTFKVEENGDIVGFFWARDLLDACKVAIIHVKEHLGI